MHLDHAGNVSAKSGIRTHGVRGVAAHGGQLYVAGSGNRVSVLDLDSMEHIRSFVVEGATQIHQIRWYNDALYVVSTGNDTVVVCDAYGVPLRVDDYCQYRTHYGVDRLHVNSIAWTPAGDMLLLFMLPGVIVAAAAPQVPIVHGLDSGHDVAYWRHHILTNSSMDRSTWAYARQTSTLRIVRKEYDRGDVHVASHWRFARGLATTPDRLICGASPLLLREFALTENRWVPVRTVDLLQDPCLAVYDIALDPRDWLL